MYLVQNSTTVILIKVIIRSSIHIHLHRIRNFWCILIVFKNKIVIAKCKNAVEDLAQFNSTSRWNANGNWLLTASRDHLLKLFDIRNTKEEIQTFRGHKKEASTVAWHPGESILSQREFLMAQHRPHFNHFHYFIK